MNLRMGQSVPQIAGKFQLAPAAVHAALAYYFDHQADVDAIISGDEEYLEAFKRDNPSPLQARIRTLSA